MRTHPEKFDAVPSGRIRMTTIFPSGGRYSSTGRVAISECGGTRRWANEAKVSSARRTTAASGWADATTDSAASAASASSTMNHLGATPLPRGRSAELLILGPQAKIVALLGVSRSVVARRELRPILAPQGRIEPRALQECDHGVEVGSLRREHRGDEGIQCRHPSGLMVESHDLESTP